MKDDEQGRKHDSSALREKAENLLRGRASELHDLCDVEIEKLLQELHTHQIELDLQNEELRRVQIELEITRDKYYDFFDFAPFGYFSISEKGLILETNLRASNLLGLERGFLIDKPFSQFVAPDSRDAYFRHRRSLLETSKPQTVEITMIRQDGTHFFAHLESLIVFEGPSSRCRQQSAVTDISELKEVERALRESRDYLQTVVDAVPVATFVIDLDCQVLLANNAARRSIGDSGGYVGDGLTCSDLICRTHFSCNPDKESCPLHRVIETCSPVTLTHHYEDASGHTRVIEISAAPIFDHQGEVVQMVESHRDITEQTRAEATLRREKDNLLNVLEAMQDGVYIVDEEYNIRYVNPVLAKDFGPYEGRKCYDYFQGRRDVCPWCKSIGVFQNKTVRWEWHSPTTERTYDLIGTPLKNPDGSIHKLEIFRDITDRKKMEQELAAVNETLERRVAERTAVIEQRAAQLRRLATELTRTEQRERRRLGRVLHDHLQQLLVGAKFQLGQLERQFVQDREMRSIVGRIQDTIDQSLTTTRSLNVELSPPVLHEGGMRHILDWLASWTEEKHGLEVTVAVDPAVDSIGGDRMGQELREVLFFGVRELLFNVVKHGGVDRAFVKASSLGHDRIIVEVIDEGAGFDTDIIEDRGQPAAGVGLLGLRERLEALGGRIEIVSSRGAGTHVTLIIEIDDR